MTLQARIKKNFGSFTLDVDIDAGSETLGFLGASGCGKSLTLRCIAGIETPDEGRIVVNDEVFFDSEKRINLSPQQRKTALLFQNYMLFPNLTVKDNVAAGIEKKIPRDEREARIASEIQRFGLSGFEDRYPSQLSGGQQQRVALARMLAARPGILMLDEPFSALDAHLKSVLEQNLVDLFAAFEGTILYVSHDIDEALRFCDRIAVVESGHIMEIDTKDELVNDPKSEAALKLSGCKNAVVAEYETDHSVWIPRWGVSISKARPVPKDVKYLGVRAFMVERASGSGENNFKVRVDRSSDSRFDRSLMLGFMDRGEDQDDDPHDPDQVDDEMKFLHQHLFWRINTLQVDKADLPEVGDILWVHIPEDKVYLVTH